ncbi:MAG: DegT/DnrJ/EryC1/StrS family aminotransferase [Bacteroidota bacterium]
MSLQMVDLRRQVAEIREELDAAIAAVLDSGAFVRGPFVRDFQEGLGAFLTDDRGTPHTLGVANGTDALQIAYQALGLGPGDEVIMPAFTFCATAEAAALLGATPVFADIDPATFNLDPAQVEAAITPRTKAIVPVHLFGQCAELAAFERIAERHGLALIEDTAQAVGTQHIGPDGTLRWAGTVGDIGTVSFYPSKNLGAYGDGGALLSHSATLHELMRQTANHGAARKYYHTTVGVNSRLDGIQAAILGVHLRHLPAWTRARQLVAACYDAAFIPSAFVTRPARASYSTHVFHQYVVRVPAAARDRLRDALKVQGIPSMVYYPVPLHEMPAFADARVAGSLAETERACREVLALPMHPWLSMADVERVADAVLSFFGERTVEATASAAELIA